MTRQSAAIAARTAESQARRAEYARLRREGLSVAAAAKQVGVRPRTARYYEANLNDPGVSRTKTAAAGRREDYVELRDQHGYTRAEAAKRLGVCARTIQRYETALRAGGAR